MGEGVALIHCVVALLDIRIVAERHYPGVGEVRLE